MNTRHTCGLSSPAQYKKKERVNHSYQAMQHCFSLVLLIYRQSNFGEGGTREFEGRVRLKQDTVCGEGAGAYLCSESDRNSVTEVWSLIWPSTVV